MKAAMKTDDLMTVRLKEAKQKIADLAAELRLLAPRVSRAQLEELRYQLIKALTPCEHCGELECLCERDGD